MHLLGPKEARNPISNQHTSTAQRVINRYVPKQSITFFCVIVKVSRRVKNLAFAHNNGQLIPFCLIFIGLFPLCVLGWRSEVNFLLYFINIEALFHWFMHNLCFFYYHLAWWPGPLCSVQHCFDRLINSHIITEWLAGGKRQVSFILYSPSCVRFLQNGTPDALILAFWCH